MTPHARLAVGLALTLQCAAVAVAAATSGPAPRDPAWAGGGTVTVHSGSLSTLAALAPAPDGGVAATGQAVVQSREQVLVVRRGPDGAPATGFGDGSAIARFGETNATDQRGMAVAVRPDGSVLVAGVADTRMFLARFRPDGALDPAFGAAGVAFVTRRGQPYFDTDTGPVAMALLADGRIALAGSVPGVDGTTLMAARLNANGTLDTTFANTGLTTAQLGRRQARGAPSSAALGMALATDGSSLLVGRATDARGRSRALLARIRPDGRLDKAFPRGEDVIPGAIQLDVATIDGDGLLVSGAGRDGILAPAGLVARLRADGSLDPTFARGGIRLVQLGLPTRGHDARSELTTLARDGSGGIVAAGRAGATTGARRVEEVRLDASGSVRCPAAGTGRQVFVGAESPARGARSPTGALAVGVTALHFQSLARLLADEPFATRAEPTAATGPIRLLGRRRVQLTGVADPGCGPARAIFVAGRRKVQAGRLDSHAGPQAVTATVRLKPGTKLPRYRLAVTRAGAR